MTNEKSESEQDLELIKETEKLTKEEARKKLKETYLKIITILKKYMDLKEEYYNLNALWIIGTYFHSQFLTYPYFFYNSMKGSGKTRMLKLLAALSRNGKVLTDIKEAVLFRTAKESTFCIDEIEGIGRKEKATLRELLNGAYKRGIGVERARKIFGEHSEFYKVDKFDVFCPIAMANIWGMEDVLSDRCIYLVLEKSSNPRITKLLEIFEEDEDINEVKKDLVSFSVMSLSLNIMYILWNKYITNFTTNDTNNNTTYNNTIQHTREEKTKVLKENISLSNQVNETTLDFFDRVNETTLDSRHLELFFPLFIIADYCDVLNDTIKTAEEITIAKQEEDIIESKDVILMDFISQKKEDREYIPMRDLIKEFKDYLEEDEEDAKWTNIKWLGKALRRLNLVKRKRRLSTGREVILDFEKARSQIRMFKPIIEKKEENICPECKLKVEEADWDGERGICKWCAESKKEKLEK